MNEIMPLLSAYETGNLIENIDMGDNFIKRITQLQRKADLRYMVEWLECLEYDVEHKEFHMALYTLKMLKEALRKLEEHENTTNNPD